MGFIFAIIFVIYVFVALDNVDFFNYSYFYDGRKELKIWLPTNLIQFLNRILELIFGLSYLFTFSLLMGEDWLFAIVSLIISVIGIFYFKIRSKYKRNLDWAITTIENIDEDGFEIHEVKNGKVKSIKKIIWGNIAKASLKKQELRLHEKNGQKLFINPSTKHFYSLIKQTPKKFTNITYQQVNAHFKGLKPCLVCGSIASNGYHCRACETPIWRKEFSKYYDNKRDYVKAKQLNLFASLQKNSQEALIFNRDETFDLHQNWKLLTSEEEIKRYSGKRWWIL